MTDHLHPLPKNEALAFAMSGNARITLRSKKTGTRFSYRIGKHKEKALWFVSVLMGPNNEADYRYIGIIDLTKTVNLAYAFRRTAKSAVAENAPSMVAFKFFYSRACTQKLPDSLEIFHEGRCGRCGRTLTVPESIESGYGPECVMKVAA